MKRSEINTLIIEAEAFFARHQVLLPPFCAWTPAKWKTLGPEVRTVVERGLGWDVTDLGSGDFLKQGLLLVTTRNGVPGEHPGANYAEKVMISRPGQITPAHFHHYKTEDIIVRGGGRLVAKLWWATADDKLDTAREVTVLTDGVSRTLRPGADLVLHPGESVTLPPRLYHLFHGHPADDLCLLGEVSKANDDHTDNRFLDPLPRFPGIEEDAPPHRLLVGDYRRYWSA